MLPQRLDQQPLVTVPNSLRSQLERAQRLVEQSEQAEAYGNESLAAIKAHAAAHVLERLAQSCPEMAGLAYVTDRGNLGFELNIIDRTDQYQVIEHTFLGMSLGKEVVNVPSYRSRHVDGRVF